MKQKITLSIASRDRTMWYILIEHTANAVVIKQEPIEDDIDEEKEVPAHSIEVSAEAAAAVPIK